MSGYYQIVVEYETETEFASANKGLSDKIVWADNLTRKI